MNSTHLQPNSAIDAGLQSRIATPYVWEAEDQRYRNISLMQVPEAQGCGSIFTSVTDYIKWIRAVMNQEHPISNRLYENLMRPRFLLEDRDVRGRLLWYAAGWMVQESEGIEIVFHTGGTSGFSSIQFFLPELKFGGVILENADGNEAGDLANSLAIELIEEVLNSTIIRTGKRDAQGAAVDLKTKSLRANPRRRQCPDDQGDSKQHIPLKAYTGRYCNLGYKCMVVKDSAHALFVDATDRSQGFTLTFEHVCNQTIYIALMSDYWDGDEEELAAEFKFVDEEAVQMGLMLEEELEDYIWFDRVPPEGLTDQIVPGLLDQLPL